MKNKSAVSTISNGAKSRNMGNSQEKDNAAPHNAATDAAVEERAMNNSRKHSEFVAENAGRSAEIDLSVCHKILVVKIDHIGDFVLATPFLRGLRKSAKNATIDLIVSSVSYPIAKLCPYADAVVHAQLQIENGKINRIDIGGDPQSSHDFMSRYSQKEYDLTLVPRWTEDYFGNPFVAKNSGASSIVGFSVPAMCAAHHLDYSNFYTHVIHRPFAAHDVEHNDALLQYVGGSSDTGPVDVWIEESDRQFAHQVLNTLCSNRTKNIICVCPGASEKNHMLPVKKLASILCRVKQIVSDIQFIILGGPGEKQIGLELAQSTKDCHNFCGITSITQAAALLSLSTMAISMDSGPAHIAAGVDVPVVVFSPHPKDGDPIDNHSPVRFRPWGKAKSVILQPEHAVWPCKDRCRGMGPNCIIAILDEDAVQAIVGILQDATLSPFFKISTNRTG
jgi:heptosyltransferase-2